MAPWSILPLKKSTSNYFRKRSLVLKNRTDFQGKEGSVGTTAVPYLGHVFIETGMAPYSQKVPVVHVWLIPTDATMVGHSLDFASYYQRCINHFVDTAVPLHALT